MASSEPRVSGYLMFQGGSGQLCQQGGTRSVVNCTDNLCLLQHLGMPHVLHYAVLRARHSLPMTDTFMVPRCHVCTIPLPKTTVLQHMMRSSGGSLTLGVQCTSSKKRQEVYRWA